MAFSEDFYTQSSSRPLSQHLTSPHITSSPPPPPPKPDSHNTSGRETPQSTHSIVFTQSASERPPPPPLPTTNSVLNDSRPLPPTPTPSNATGNPSSLPNPSTIPDFPPLSYPQSYLPPNLLDKPISELTPLLTSPVLLTALASTHPSLPAATSHLQSALTTNLHLTHSLTHLESHLQTLRTEVAQLQLQHSSLRTQWGRKQGEMDAALEPWSPRGMYARLVAGVGEMEGVVGATERSFLDVDGDGDGIGQGRLAGEREVGDWVRRVREGVKGLEMRREERRRWDEGRVGGWR